MSIINNSNKFIFIHIPKTAGTTVTSVLSKYTNYCDLEIGGTEFGEKIQSAYIKRFGIKKHSPAMNIKAIIGDITWSKYFSFAFVRNPFSRALSTFYFLRKWDGPNTEFKSKMLVFESFDEYVLSDLWDKSNGPDEIFRPQMYWLKSSVHTNDILVDHIAKLENIDSELLKIIKVFDPLKAEMVCSQIPKLNMSEKSDKTSIKDPLVIEKIVHKYRVDFDTFGYSTNPQEE